MDEIITLAQHIYAAAQQQRLRIGVDKDVDIISAYKPVAEMHPHEVVHCWMAMMLLQDYNGVWMTIESDIDREQV